MLTRIWTGFLLSGLCASLVALVVVYMHEKGVYPFRDAWSRLGRQPWGRRIAIAAFVVSMWVYASVKPGDGGGNGGGDGGGDGGGTNNIQMVIGPGGLPQAGSPGAVTNTLDHGVVGEIRPIAGGVLGDPAPVVDEWSDFTPITSTNTTRTLTGDDFRRGVVMTRIGTDEEFDFAPPQDATIVSDWQAFGAATDWIYVALTNWAFSVATNDVERLRVYSFGKIEPLIREEGSAIAPNYWFAPFMASLGVVPEAYWSLLNESARPSRVWYCVTHRNTFVVTWANVLLDRDAGSPISFQVEFWPDGRFVYRYDFSRIDAETVEGILAGASFSGNTWITNSLPTNVTSMAFCPLAGDDAYNQDSDGDGIATIDELFVHYTDPHNADSDSDGLSDYEELFVYNTNPLNSYSVSDAYCDAVAVRIGDLDPFSFPEGSTNTVLEHIFYSGTTNGVFAYPQPSAEVAVLKVMVSGIGTGRLVVGDAVVPLVAPPQMRSGAVTNTLLLAVGRGVRKEVWFDKPDGLDVALDSDDFLIGEMPTWYWAHGWLAFPHTDATVPCIHDLYAKARTVTLVHGEEFAGLAATWKSEEQGVAITNVPPVSAEIHGSFPKNQTRTICYTMSHPDYMGGQTNYVQTLEFCPKLTESEDLDDPPDEEEEPYYSCECGWSGTCNCCTGEWCHCTCWDCPCNQNQSPALADDEEAEDAYTNIVSGALQPLANTLYLYRANTRAEHLGVPTGAPVKCCPCPDHCKSNYVAKAFCSRRLAVDYAGGGEEFRISHDPCDVTIFGVSPSRAFYDASVLFVTNGTTYKVQNYTVLGVKIDRPSWMTPVDRYGQLSASFGFPVEVCSNLYDASELVLRTDVLLDGGYVRLALEDATGDFEIWLKDWYDNQYTWHEPEKLLDGTSHTERYFSMRKWRGIMRRYSETRELCVKVRSLSEGSCRLRFEYVAANGGCHVHDFADQMISSVSPVLLVDYDRDGAIGATDIARLMAGRYAYFWRNDDKWKGDNAFDLPFINRVNSSDDVVNGRNDLINFLPVSVDVAPFAAHWSSGSVYYRLEAHSSALRNAKLAFADIARTQIGDAPLGEDMDVDGNALHEAPVSALGGGTNLPPAFVSLSQTGSGTIIMEFPDFARDHELYLNVYAKSDDALLFSAKLKLHIGDVSNMLGWENLRSAAGGSGGVPTRLATDDWPEDEHEDGNLVFVHGYNMEEDVETQLWAQNVFKKLWWSGLDRGFVAVQWRGNEGQTPLDLPLVGYVTPNYYGNVQNAFQTAPALSNAMETVQGPKWFLAHSLGNMLVSAAIQDYGMPHEKYFMLNAAVAMEAFDPTNGITQASHDNMTPEAWTNYTDRVRATHWYELFPGNDGRRSLTWKGRFCNVTNIVNFYSSQEEVVCNGDGKPKDIAREYSWYNQEYCKGEWALMSHPNEGGWAFNRYYDTVTHPDPDNELLEVVDHLPPDDADNLSDEALRQHPLFLDFVDSQMHSSSNGAVVASNYLYRAEMLAYAIPSESYAVGANPLPGRDDVPYIDRDKPRLGSYNMAVLFDIGIDDLPINGTNAKDKHRDWQHSTFVQRSYKRVHQLFKKITQLIKDNQQ